MMITVCKTLAPLAFWAAVLTLVAGVACAPASPAPGETDAPGPAAAATATLHAASTPTPAPRSAGLGQEFQMRASERVQVEGLGLLLFREVTEDSRCPSDVTCIQAGRAVVMLVVGQPGREIGLINGAGQDAQASAESNGFLIRLLNVEPYPKSTEKIRPADYRITLIVTRTSATIGGSPTQEPVGGNADLIIRQVPIESVDVLILESFPVQVRAHVKGYFPDGCTTLHETRQERSGNAVTLTITSKRPKEAFCTQAIVPYDATIPLEGQFPAGDYSLTVNGVRKEFRVS